MVNTKAKYEALVAAYGGEQTQKTGKSTQKSGQPQQVTDTKAKYEALLAVYGDDPKPQVAARPTMPTNDQIVAGARQALQKHQSENQQKWNGWQKDAAAKAAAQPPKTGVVTLMEPVILPSAREEAPSLAQLAEQAQRAYDDYLATYDLEAGQKEINTLEGELKKLKNKNNMKAHSVNSRPYAVGQQENPDGASYTTGYGITNTAPYAISLQTQKNVDPSYGRIRELEKLIAEKKQDFNQAKHYQESLAFASAAENEDFEENSLFAETDDELYKWINDKQFREKYETPYQSAPNPGARKSKYSRKGYGYMTVDEIKLFNYYYATGGREKAQAYLDNIQEDLNARAGADIAERLKGKTGTEIAYGGAVGLDQFGSGMSGAWNLLVGKGGYTPVSRQQAAGQIVREDLGEKGAQLPSLLGGGSLAQIGYDLVSTTANMAPSILTSTMIGIVNPAAGAAVGSGLMGASAAGNAYKMALNEGYDKASARTYAASIGVAETAMQSILGGIGKLGGISPAVTKAVEGIDNGLLRFAARYGASMASEGLEEGLQEVLDPILQNAILDADANIDWAQVVYSALLGAMSAGVIEGSGQAVDATVSAFQNINNMLNQKQQEQKPINPDAHVELADMQVEFERETWDLCDRLAKATGRNIKLYQHYGPGSSAENGYFEDGVIYVNTKSGDPVAQIVSHELTHSVEFAKEYQELSRMVLGRIEAMGGDLKQLRQQKADLYAQEGHPLGSQAEVDQEIVAEYVAKNLLTNEQQIMAVAQQNRTLAEKIKAWVDKLLAAIGNKDAAERTYLTNVQNLYAKALQQPRSVIGTGRTVIENGKNVGAVADSDSTQVQNETTALNDTEELDWNDPVQIRTWAQNMLSSGQITEEEFNGYIDLAEQTAEENAGRETFTEKKHSISSGRKYSFAGPNARTANSQTLAEAKAMDEAGAANETIRQQTGWFRGMDGKWRFEVDDSSSRISENVSNYMTLGELLQDAEILKAYPNMEDVSVVFQSLPDGVNASYSPQFDSIDVSYKLKGNPEAIREAVLHEVQHVVQQWEGFTKGTNVGAWERKLKSGFDSRRGADIRKARETEQELRRVQQEEPEFYRDMMELDAMTPDGPRGEVNWDTLEQITDDPPEWQAFDARRDELQETYGDMKVWDFMDLLYQQEKAAKSEGRTAIELYWDTAGEIEARNTAGRRNLTAEERKNTPPNLGDEDTVFAEGNMRSDDYIPGNISEQEIESGIQTVSEMNPVTAISGTEFIKEGGNLLNEVSAFFQSIGGQVFNPQLGDVHLTKRGVKDDLAHGMSQNKAASFAAIPDVLRNGSVVGFEKNWKGRGYDSATVAAPITIGEDDYMMAVVVHRSNSENKFYIHDVFTIKEEVTPFITGTQNLGAPGGATSTISIIRKILDVKKKNTNQNPAIEAVPDTGKIGIVSANMNRNGASQVPDENAPSLNVHDELASAPNGIVPSENPTVKRQMSISPTVSRKNVADDLRGILSRGGDVAELRKYISQLEQSGGNAERSGRNAYQNGATAEQSEPQRIISMAKRYGISVDEYLRRNWEQFEVDGEWNEAARKALELERQGRKYSISDTDNQGRKLTKEQQEFFKNSKAKTGGGSLLVLYHQTANDFTVFDTRREGAGKRDNATPFGIFLKSTDKDIGLKGQKQMPLYANITNPLNAQNREELLRKFRELSPEYDTLQDAINGLDQEYHSKYEHAQQELRAYIVKWREEHKSASRTAIYDDVRFTELYDAEDQIVDEWTEKGSELDERAKNVITDALIQAGYDGVILHQDQGSFGRSTDAYIALHPNQVKNVDNLTPTYNPDIRYSISSNEEQTEQMTAEQIRQDMPVKARNVLMGAQRKLLTELQNKLGVNKFTNLDDLKGIVEEIANAYLTEGHVDQEKVDQLFKLAYDSGIVRDAEFYEQYKEIKSHLRNTAVTISEGDSHDIADFRDFKRRNFGTLRIVKEGGLPVDSAYHELTTMAPELFPESITHPADQLVRMAEVARSIQVSEQNLNTYYGADQESFRKYARHDFENAVAEIAGDLRQVKRYVEGTTETEEAAPTTPQEAAEYYKQLKDARRAYERVQAKNLLTPRDEMQVGRLLRGEILPEDLDPEKDYVKGITAVFEAKKEYERLSKLIAEYKRAVRAGYRENADKLLETANEWQDKKIGLAYSRENMERNIDDIVPDKEVAKAIKREYFEAVHISEAEATRFKTKFRDRVRGMNLSTKIDKENLVSEAHAVQLLGEAEDNIRVLRESRGRMKMRDGKTMEEWNAVIMDMWKENPGLDQGKIRAAVKEFRTVYDELFQMMNAERVRNGYEPVNYRQGYFPHFQPGQGDGILGAFGKALNIDTSVAALPTTINGLTHTFKPGIQWFGNAQERLGFNTAYDAVEGFDKYIEGVASVIYQTENIQKLRALASQIRYRTSEEGIRKQVDAIRARDNLSEEEKQVQINDIYEHGRYTLSNFVNELDEYTNLLANKKSKLDRTMEAMIGRKAYAVMKAWEARVGANMIAGNLSSALTNFIPLTQAGAQLDAGSMLKGVRDTLLINTGIWLDKKSLLKGMAATLKAIKEDDGIAGMSSFLTNRKGSDPLVQTWTQKASKKLGMPMELIDGFTSESIVRAAYFQNLKKGMSETEALHQADVFASHVMADRSKGAMPTLFESSNPIFKAFTQFQLEVNNQFSEVFKDLPRGHRERGLAALTLVLLKYFLGAFLYNEVYEYFVGRRAALDPFGILNDTVGDLTGYELPNLVEWGTNAIRGKETSFETDKVGIGTAGKNLTSNLLGEMPFSSGLTLLGIETDGGRIPASSAVPDLTAVWDAATTEGWSAEKRWKEVQDELNKLSYVIPPFGGNQIGKAIKGAKAFAKGGSYSVDAEGNDILQYPVYKDASADAIGNALRMGVFGKSALPEAQDWVASGFKSLNAKQTATYQNLVETGANDREAYSVIHELQNAQNLKGMEKLKAQQRALSNASLTDEEKTIVVGYILGTEMLTDKGKPTTYANFLSAVDRGLSVDDFMDMRSMGVDVEEYLELTDSGVASDTAVELAYGMYDLEAGQEEIEDTEYWRLIVNASDNEYLQMSMLGTRMRDSTFEKLTRAQKLDVSPDMFVTYYESRSKYDTDGNGSYTSAEVKAVIDAMGKQYSNEQKGVLWQMATGSTSTKNNPYSKAAGQKWLDAKKADKEKG